MRSSSIETEALREAYAALNRGDVAGFVAIFDPRIERVEFPGFPQSGTYRGLEEVTAHVIKGRSTWAEGGCTPTRFLVAGDKVIAFVHVHVRVNGETEWRDGRIADGFTFRNGRAFEFYSFAEEQQALQWACIEPADATCRDERGC